MNNKRIRTTFHDFVNEQNSIDNINELLDKINKDGIQSLTYDERTYLNQYNNNNIDTELEKWLFSDKEETFDSNSEKLLFDIFEEDEDILYNYDKLKRVITKHIGKKPFTNNADWGGAYVWNINSTDNYTGTFLYLGDDELVVIKRELENDDEYIDDIKENITDSKGLYKFFLNLPKK